MQVPDPRPARACLVLHGLGGGPYELQPLIDRLQAESWSVHAPILPGHDMPGERMPPSRWQDWIAEVESAWHQLLHITRANPASIVVFGFSTGGTLALELALRQPVARLVLLAPFLQIKYMGLLPVPPESIITLLAQILPNLPRTPPAVNDPAMRPWAQIQESYKTFNLKAAASALELIDQLRPRVHQIRAPVLIQQGKLDQVVEPSGARWLYDHIGSPIKQLTWYDQSNHLLALDRQRFAVIDEAVAFAARTDATPR